MSTASPVSAIKGSRLPSAERPHGKQHHQPQGGARRCIASSDLLMQPGCPARSQEASREESRAAHGPGKQGCECGGLSDQYARGKRCLKHSPRLPRCCEPGNHPQLSDHPTSLSDPSGSGRGSKLLPSETGATEGPLWGHPMPVLGAILWAFIAKN